MRREEINDFDKVVNQATGEIIDAKDIRPIDVVRKTVSNFDNKLLLNSPYFHLIVSEESNLLERLDLNFADIGKLLMMLTYTNFRNVENKKIYLAYDNKQSITSKNTKALKEKLKINNDQFYRFKKRLMDNNVLFEDDKGLYFKDDLIIRGKLYSNEKKNSNFYRLYDNTIREIYDVLTIENKASSSKGLGILVCLLPFMQKQNNVLMSKYYNKNTAGYEPLKPTHLADLLNIDRKALSREIKSMNKIAVEKTGKSLIYEVSLKAYGETDERKIQRAILLEPTFSYNSHGENFNKILTDLMTLTAHYPELE